MVAKSLVFLIRGYQLVLSPVMGGQCRFYPTCSEYALQALASHGIMRGAMLAVWRILRCQPFCQGGFDEVPPARDKAD